MTRSSRWRRRQKSVAWAQHVYRLLRAPGRDRSRGIHDRPRLPGGQAAAALRVGRALARSRRCPKARSSCRRRWRRSRTCVADCPRRTARSATSTRSGSSRCRARPAQPDGLGGARLRRFLRERLGLPDPLPPVQAEKIGREEQGGSFAEFWLLETEPGIRLPGVLLGGDGRRRDDRPGPRPDDAEAVARALGGAAVASSPLTRGAPAR